MTILLTGSIAVRGSSPFNRIEFCMKKNLLAVAVLCALTSGAAFAQQVESPWLVRVRAVHLDSANKDSTGLGLSINNKTIPEFDITYFFNKNVAAELVLTVPQKHDVRSNGTNIGTLKHLPPSLLLQYHFDAPGFKPYVGAGVNYTRFSSLNLPAGVGIDRNSWGGALQVGVDIPLNKNLSLNFDVKKVYIKTDVFAGGVKAGTFKVDPVLVGVGLGWRF
ncbi:outer membrane protein [Acidovorax soli]|uniref:Outer membrane protein n=2 Tax=Acidovorax soli TaxID=592050 RepID=A0A1H3VNM8_9BURK|nr:outer membrane protein [Acidovorax soli]